MPIHDWTGVDAGIFHDFHLGWSVELLNAFNGGLLPVNYYALAEQTDPIQEPYAKTTDLADLYAKKANRIAIRHSSDDRLIAIIELLSPRNKSSRHAIDMLLEKVFSVLDQGVHLLLIELVSANVARPARGSCVDLG